MDGSPFRYYTSASHITHAFCVPDSKLFYKSAPLGTPNPFFVCFLKLFYEIFPKILIEIPYALFSPWKTSYLRALTRECYSPGERVWKSNSHLKECVKGATPHPPISFTLQAWCRDCVFMHPHPCSCLNIAPQVYGKSPCAFEIHAFLIPPPLPLLFIYYPLTHLIHWSTEQLIFTELDWTWSPTQVLLSFWATSAFSQTCHLTPPLLEHHISNHPTLLLFTCLLVATLKTLQSPRMSHLWYYKLKLASLIITSYFSRSLSLLFSILQFSLNVPSINALFPSYRVTPLLEIHCTIHSPSPQQCLNSISNFSVFLYYILCQNKQGHQKFMAISLDCNLKCDEQLKQSLTQALVLAVERFEEVRKKLHHSKANHLS